MGSVVEGSIILKSGPLWALVPSSALPQPDSRCVSLRCRAGGLESGSSASVHLPRELGGKNLLAVPVVESEGKQGLVV